MATRRTFEKNMERIGEEKDGERYSYRAVRKKKESRDGGWERAKKTEHTSN